MEHKEIYYYNPKYPEHGIGTLPIAYIQWLSTSTNDDAARYIHGIGSDVNIETGQKETYGCYYSLYNPYSEDEDMFVHDLPGNRERILSFNREKLEEWWQEDVRVQCNIAKKRLEELKKCLNQK